MSLRPVTLLLSTVLALPLLCSAAAPADLRYKVSRQLYNDISSITRISNAGEVAGVSYVVREGYIIYSPFWTSADGPGRELDFIHPNAQIVPAALRDEGGIVGWLRPNDGSGSEQAFILPAEDASVMTIPPGAGMSQVRPTSVSNGSGPYYVAGSVSAATGSHAFRWTMNGWNPNQNVMQDLGTLGGSASDATDVNAAGMVTGWAQTAAGDRHAFLYANGAMVDLGALAGRTSVGNAINDDGTVVGSMRISVHSAATLGFVYQDGGLTYLDTLGGDASKAVDINNLGWIVGSATLADGTWHAFVAIDGTMIDVNSLLAPQSGWQIYDAHSINDSGQILATGCRAGECGYVILSAVPEPAAWALLLAGLPVAAALRRRRVR